MVLLTSGLHEFINQRRNLIRFGIKREVSCVKNVHLSGLTEERNLVPPQINVTVHGPAVAQRVEGGNSGAKQRCGFAVT
jgi:hypothetical protein